MNRTDRLSAILIMLQTKQIITASEIAERFDISLRTVYRDMRALDEAGVPIGAETGKGYYLVEGYHLPPVMFTTEEAGSMLLAGKLVDNFTDISVKQYYNLAIDKIKSVLPDSQLNTISELNSQVHVIHRPTLVDVNCPNNYIVAIQKALSTNSCLEIKYNSNYNNRTTTRTIEPLSLCFYGFQWHIIAFCRLRNDYRDFRIDRVMELEIIDKCRKNNDNFSLEKYFKSLWNKQELYKVVVRFNKKITDSISNVRYFYGFYEEIIEEEYIKMKFAVNNYDYIANWLISLTDSIVPVSPPELIKKIKEKVQILAKKYVAEKTVNKD